MGDAGSRFVEGSHGNRVPLVRSLNLSFVLILLGMVKYGFGPIPAFSDYLELAQAWQELGRIPASAGYVGHSPTTFMLLGTLGLTSDLGFRLGNMLLHVIAVGLPVVMPLARRDSLTQGLVFIFVAGGAILPSLTYWIGGYDSIFVIAATVVALARNRWIRCGAWSLLAFQHSQMAVLALFLWIALELVHRRGNLTRGGKFDVWLAVGGVLAGSIAIQFMAHRWGLTQTRSDYLELVGIPTMAQMFWARAWLVLFGVLGVGWFVLLDHRLRGAAVTKALLGGGLLMGFVLPHLVIDQVRVPALVMLVPVLTWIRFAPDVFDESTLLQIRRVYLPIAVVLPVVLVWEGLPYSPGWSGLLDQGLRLAF